MRLTAMLLGFSVLILGSCKSASSSDSNTDSFSDVPDYTTSASITKSIDADVPGWIKDNFTNIRAYMDGDTVVIETRSLPPYKTYYYQDSYSSLSDPSTTPLVTNPNKIVSRKITLRVPKSPTLSASNLDAQKSTAGLGVIGVSVNGVVLFNDDANTANGDEIVNEIPTMDSRGGHPTEHGVYHYHIEPAVLSADGSNPNGDLSHSGDELLGIAIDGLPIFGPKDSAGNVVFDAGGNANAQTSPDFRSHDNWIAASAQQHPPTLYASQSTNDIPDVHYHTVANFYLKTTKDVPSVGTAIVTTGTIEPDFYMIGDNIAGTKGTVSDEVTP